MELDGHRIELSAAIGMALWPDDASNADELCRKADEAMYRCKQLDNPYLFYGENSKKT